MAAPPNIQKLVLALVVVTFLTTSPSISEFGEGRWGNSKEKIEEMRKLVLGSKPPRCVDKCRSCKPCMATLVVPPHDHLINKPLLIGDDGGYYLLSWSCKCGNKFFKP